MLSLLTWRTSGELPATTGKLYWHVPRLVWNARVRSGDHPLRGVQRRYGARVRRVRGIRRLFGGSHLARCFLGFDCILESFHFPNCPIRDSRHAAMVIRVGHTDVQGVSLTEESNFTTEVTEDTEEEWKGGLDSASVHAVYSVYTEMTDTTANRCETEMPHMSSPRRPLRVVIPGGAGHLGRIVAGHLHARGNAVTVLSRSGAVAPWQIVSWNGADSDDWERELEDADVVINLAGRSVNCRYNRNNRREILESRIRTTELLGEAISKLHRPPRLWVNASTATIYRHSLDREMDEANGKLGGQEPDVPDSWRFSIEVATSWERTLFAATTPHTRKIALRSAMVMSAERGR